jgi:hypothetical protein
MSATAARPRLPQMMPAERPKLKVAPEPDLQAQFDVLAQAFAAALERINAQAIRIDALERLIRLPKRLADVEQFSTVVPATENAPARRVFDASSFLSKIAERATT